MMLEDALAFVTSELPMRSRLLFKGYTTVGAAHFLLGHTADAIGALNEALVLTDATPDARHACARAYSLGLLALAHGDHGDWARATRHARTAEELLTGLELSTDRLPMLTARATIAAHAGDRENGVAAITEARDALPAARAVPCMQAELSLRCAIAAHRLGYDEIAITLASDAETECHRLGDPGAIPDRIQTFRERMIGIDPLLASLSPAERRVLRQLATHRTRGEIAARLYVSPSTIKSHVASIYAKLGVFSRSDAVAALGLDPADVDGDVTQLTDIALPLRAQTATLDRRAFV